MAEATINCGDKSAVVDANGNGRLDAVSNAIKQYFGISYELSVYEEHALSHGSSSKAVAYVGITCNGKSYWGAGMDEDIIKASIHALTVAVNKLPQIQSDEKCLDERLVAMMNYMQTNYQTVTLEEWHSSSTCQHHIFPNISRKIRKNFWRTGDSDPHETCKDTFEKRKHDCREYLPCSRLSECGEFQPPV